MKKINLCRAVYNLKKEALKDEAGDPVLVSKLVANVLVNSKAQKDAIRQMRVAQKIYDSTGQIELEDADLDMVKKAVDDSTLTCLVKAAFDECMGVAGSKEK